MRWISHWWGIEITAENDSDEALLRQLAARLPHDIPRWQETEPNIEVPMAYEQGKIEVRDRNQNGDEGYTIVFMR